MDALINDLTKIRNGLLEKRYVKRASMLDYARTCDEAIRKLEYYKGYSAGLNKRKERVHPTTQTVDSTIDDFLKEIDDINGIASSIVYKAYCDYCKSKAVQPLTHIEFSRQVNRALKSNTIIKRIDKTVCRVFSRGGGEY